MEEIKINVSTKVWVYTILAIVAVYAVFIGISYYVRGMNSALDMLFLLIIVGIFNFTSLTVKTKEEWIVQFDGVESFYVDKFKGRTFIGIRYKDNTEEAKTDEEIAQNRKLRSKSALQGYPYEIYVRGLSKTPQEICNLLNQRISK